MPSPTSFRLPWFDTANRIRTTGQDGFWLLALGLLTIILAARAVSDFSHPLSDGNDTDQFEYVGYVFSKNLVFNPLPHLNLANNQTFYPYGMNQVFLDWGFERDYWYASCYRLFDGPGPYLQYYYVGSLLITALGTYWLLHSRFGRAKAFGVGLIVSVFNFYALYKFPVHMNVCVAHWTTLCIVATYCLLGKVSIRQPVTLPFLLGWVWLHVLILGQELGYVAGFALTFTTLAAPFLLVGLWKWASAQPADHSFSGIVQLGTRYVAGQYRQHQFFTLLLLFLIGLSLYLYLPLTLQIALTAWRFDFGEVPELPAWSHPLRLLIPYWPGLDTFSTRYDFNDTFESYGQGSPGLYLVLLAGIGWWQSRRRVGLWLPIVIMLVLCLTYHPVLVPTLKMFPWFSFNRHGGRASLVYPVLLCLLALPIRAPRSRVGQITASLLGLLMLVEWGHAFHLRTILPTHTATDDVLRYCAVVRRQPGVAVLDFPFCTVGANGVGAREGLCPYYAQQNAVFTFRRFYDKRGVGQYFGRLHPDQIKPFLTDGWPRLLTPGRLFTQADWQFLDDFLRKNHFAGINLYPDLLRPEQVAQFSKRYGPPITRTRFPAAGRVVFIPLRQAPEMVQRLRML